MGSRSTVYDLGIIAAERKDYFGIHKKNGDRTEPFIGHFLWHYSTSEGEFRRKNKVLPSFMALGFLRIARLGIDNDGKDFIFREAEACLRTRYQRDRRKESNANLRQKASLSSTTILWSYISDFLPK